MKPFSAIRSGLSKMGAWWSGYEGGNISRERPQMPYYRAFNADEEKHLSFCARERLVLSMEDLYRNNEIFHGVSNRMADYVVHTGIHPMPQTSSKEWNHDAEHWFKQWSKIADFMQRPSVDFGVMQWQTIVDRIVRGESGFVLIDNGQLQAVDMLRVRTPEKFETDGNVHDGMKLDSVGRPLGYFVCDRKDGYIDTSSFSFVPKENFIHVASPWRVDQKRGIPAAAAIYGKLADMREADKYTLLKLKNDAKQFLKITRQGGGGFANEIPRASGVAKDTAGNMQQVSAHDWGQEWRMKPGEDVSSFDSKTPGQYHVAYLEWQLKVIASALGLPWEFVIMVFTDGSFSAQRSALLHALHKFINWHHWLNASLNRRVWNWRIAKAMKEGDIDKAPLDKNGVSEWHKCAWALPNMGWVDPEASVKANVLAWNLGNMSLKRICAQEGFDRDDVLTEKAGDISAAIEQADALNKAHPGAAITWRDIINAATTITDKGCIGGEPVSATGSEVTK